MTPDSHCEICKRVRSGEQLHVLRAESVESDHSTEIYYCADRLGCGVEVMTRAVVRLRIIVGFTETIHWWRDNR